MVKPHRRPWPKSKTSDISKQGPSPLHHTFLLGRACFTAQPLSALFCITAAALLVLYGVTNHKLFTLHIQRSNTQVFAWISCKCVGNYGRRCVEERMGCFQVWKIQQALRGLKPCDLLLKQRAMFSWTFHLVSESLYYFRPETHKGLKRVTRIQCLWIFTFTTFGNLSDRHPFSTKWLLRDHHADVSRQEFCISRFKIHR